MIPLLFVAGGLGIAVFALASKANASTSEQVRAAQARTSGPVPGTIPTLPQSPTLNSIGGGGPNTSALIGLGATSYTGLVSAGAATGILSKTSGLISSLPIVGAIAGIGLGIFGAISAHHKQALATEGQTLNGADPLFASRLQQIVAAVNAGQISRPDGLTLVDQALAEYDSNVAKITNNPGATANSAQCNAACYIRVNYHLPAVAQVKQIISQGGTATIPPIPSHATQSGVSGYTLSVR